MVEVFCGGFAWLGLSVGWGVCMVGFYLWGVCMVGVNCQFGHLFCTGKHNRETKQSLHQGCPECFSSSCVTSQRS